ncbi:MULTISPECIES: cytochrome b [Agrobacterium]|uniref:cytochrome b n=1 Tax=Agrobacterium TaxID=357 RepID=UPI0005D3E6DC|nr:cytochrome b [Agrobacterium fabrum]
MIQSLRDDRAAYGSVSRVLHWIMALLFAWQFTGAALHLLAEDTVAAEFIWSSHRDIGFLLFVMVIVRGAWGLINLSSRPQQSGVLGRSARLGHIILYIMMIAVPGLALIRQIGSGRAFAPFGLDLLEGGGDQIRWMTEIGGLLHSPLAWLLLVFVAGHVAMVIVHQLVWRDGTLDRMAGSRHGEDLGQHRAEEK